MSFHFECAISILGKTGYVLAYHKMLKVCSRKTVETLVFLSSYTVLHAVFFFTSHFVSRESASTFCNVEP